jgi:hypothetical protein
MPAGIVGTALALLPIVFLAFETAADDQRNPYNDQEWYRRMVDSYFVESLRQIDHVDQKCVQTCWTRWAVDNSTVIEEKLHTIFSDNTTRPSTRDTVQILGKEVSEHYPAGELCEISARSRSFQRCYVSSCGGLIAGTAEGLILLSTNSSPTSTTTFGPVQKLRQFAFFSNYLQLWDFYWYAPFPLGLTAACSVSPSTAFSQNPSGQLSLSKLDSLHERLPVWQSLRKRLVPIWTSPNLPDYWYYNLQLPHITKIEDPRSLADLRDTIVSTYLFSFIAYAHLLSITSRSTFYLIELLQLLAFCFIPLLPTVQLVHNMIDALSLVFSGEPWGISYLLAGISGVVVFREQTASQPLCRRFMLEMPVSGVNAMPPSPKDGKWLLRALGILTNLALVSLTLAKYFLRLNYKYRRATYCSATGFDHRVGWVAASAVPSIAAAMMMHCISREWNLWPGANHTGSNSDWRFRLAFDATVAGLIWEILIMLTGRNTVIRVFYLTFVQHREDLVLAGFLTTFLLVVGTWRSLSLMWSNPNRLLHKLGQRVLPSLFVGFASCYAISIFFLQIFLDKEEFADLALDFVLPWNYRWQIPDPAWTQWWEI